MRQIATQEPVIVHAAWGGGEEESLQVRECQHVQHISVELQSVLLPVPGSVTEPEHPDYPVKANIRNADLGS